MSLDTPKLKTTKLKNTKFKTTKSALLAFSEISFENNEFSHTKRRSFQSDLISNLNDWTDRCDNLITPWSDSDLDNLMSINTSFERFSNIISCINIPHSKISPFFHKIISFGVNPCQYIENSRVSMLGFAAYSFNADNFKLLLLNSKFPDSRLILLEKHLSDPHSLANKDVLYSTLLHRLASRFSYVEKNSKLASMIKIFSSIIKQDPESIFLKTKSGAIAEDLCHGVELKETLYQARLLYNSKKDKDAIISNLLDVGIDIQSLQSNDRKYKI